MTIEENIIRIKEGKDNIIQSLKNKGVEISDNTLINEIPTIIDNTEIGGGGGDTPIQPDVPELTPKYEGASVFRIVVPEDNYEFTINLCNDATKATYDVDWGDGTIEHLNTSEQHHTYTESGTYDINVYNLTSEITLGERFGETNYSYLFLNSHNIYWEGNYIIKEIPDICTDIIVGSNISQIGNHAFASLNELKSIIFNDGVKYINSFAFSYTPNLKTIVLPNTLIRIYTQDSMGIEELILPNSVTSIDQIRHCNNLKRVQFSDNLSDITGFYNCLSLEEIDLSNTQLTIVGNDCFNECRNLKKVILPDTITELSWQMFLNCKNLNYFVVPNRVTKISYGCFFHCDNLVQVELPSTLTYIENNAFYGTSGLQYIISHALVAPQIEDFTFEFNIYQNGYLYIHKDADIDSYTSDYWGQMLNYGWEIKYIEDIPTEVTETTLKIKTKDNFSIIIDRIYLANLIDNQLIDDEYVFTFDKSIDKLPKFIYPKNELIGITLPNTLQYILDNQFKDCQNLTEITIPSSVTNIGNTAFQYTYNLSKIVCECMEAPIITGDNWWEYSFTDMYRNGNLYIYEGAKGFDDADSKWFQQLIQRLGWTIKYMEIPQPNNEIWYTTTDGNILYTTYIVEKFTDNTLVSNTYENGQGILTFEKDLTEIPAQMFYFLNVQSVSLPSSITTIGDSAFHHCTNLKSVKLSEGLTSIYSHAFGNCQLLNEIYLPNTLVTIGDGAFSGASLTKLVIPNNITVLPIDTFTNCYFSEIIIPSSITSIGDSCFAYCRYLHSITFNTIEPPFIDVNAFSNVGVWEKEKPKVIYIPQGANIEAYQNSECATLLANGWTIEYI